MNAVRLTRRVDVRNAWLLWLALWASVVIALVGGNSHSVSWHYTGAAECWLHRQDLYEMSGRGFLYLPQAAVLHVPYLLLPKPWSEIAWRLVSISMFAVGVRRLTRLAQWKTGRDFFPVATLVSIPLSWSSALNGQSTLVMAGLMMLGVAEIVARRYWRGALALTLALAFKPLAIVLLLLMAAMHRPLVGRLVVMLLVFAAVPYLTQDARYVSAQYHGCFQMLVVAARLGSTSPVWAQLFGLLDAMGLPVTESVQTWVRLAAALATLAAAWSIRRLPRERAATLHFAFAAGFLMLFNPRTENNTYAVLAPSIGICLAEVWLVERQAGLSVLLIGLAVGVLGSYEISRLIAPDVRTIWMAPLMCVGFLAVLAVRVVREVHRSETLQNEGLHSLTEHRSSQIVQSVKSAQSSRSLSPLVDKRR